MATRGPSGAAKSMRSFAIDPSGEDAEKALIVDLGSLHTRVGLAGREAETLTGGNLIATPADCLLPGSRAPTSSGTQVRTWDGFEQHVQHNVFAPILGVDPEDGTIDGRPLLLCEVPLTPAADREKETQIAFETFHASHFYKSIGGVLSLYQSGRTTGMVLDIGHSTCSVIPVYEGYALPHATSKVHEWGWEAKSEFWMRWFGDRGVEGVTHEDIILLLASDPAATGKYELPDGRGVSLTAEDVLDEYFTDTNKIDQERSLHRLMYRAIMACDVDIRKDFYQNVILAGGGAAVPGLPARFTTELSKLCPATITPVSVAPTPIGDTACLGGSILTGLSTFSGMWVSKAEYDEAGPAIVHRKCF
jgi:Actin